MVKRRVPVEFKELIHCLNTSGVKYLLIGGWAFSIYAEPRATKDIDFLVAVDDENLEKLRKALLMFGAPPIDMESFKTVDDIIKFGSSPNRVDFVKLADGIGIDDCFERREVVDFDGVSVYVISKQDLIINKRASGRYRDLADLEELEAEAHGTE